MDLQLDVPINDNNQPKFCSTIYNFPMLFDKELKLERIELKEHLGINQNIINQNQELYFLS